MIQGHYIYCVLYYYYYFISSTSDQALDPRSWWTPALFTKYKTCFSESDCEKSVTWNLNEIRRGELTDPTISICGKTVLNETSPWCQKGLGFLCRQQGNKVISADNWWGMLSLSLFICKMTTPIPIVHVAVLLWEAN